MDFVGTGRRLSQGDIGDAARWLGVPTAALLAFIEVEAAGRGFDNQNRPKMLFEPHVFWRELGAGKARDTAVKLGVAYQKWGAKPYPKDSYPRIKTAQTVDATKSLRSASWGLGQILADKFQICGHQTEEAFVRANMAGEREQLLCMTALLVAWGIPKLLAGKDLTKKESWAPVAAKWNGSGYAKHNYHGRIAAAFVKHSKNVNAETGMPFPEKTVVPAATVLEKGMKGEAVRNLQNDLAALGYVFQFGIDGRFGNETEKHVLNLQTKYGLVIDGKVGPATARAIEQIIAAAGTGVAKDLDSPPPVTHPEQRAAGKAPIWLIVVIALIAIVGIGFAVLSGAFNAG